jgi:hypothetical protein
MGDQLEGLQELRYKRVDSHVSICAVVGSRHLLQSTADVHQSASSYALTLIYTVR